MNEEEDETWTTEPEEMITGLNKRHAFHYVAFLLDHKSQFCYYHLKFCSNDKNHLQVLFILVKETKLKPKKSCFFLKVCLVAYDERNEWLPEE